MAASFALPFPTGAEALRRLIDIVDQARVIDRMQLFFRTVSTVSTWSPGPVLPALMTLAPHTANGAA